MKARTARELADWSLLVSLVINIGAIALHLATGHYGIGAAESVFVVAVTAWADLRGKVHDRLEARLGEAVAQRRIAEITLLQIEAAVRRGDHVEVTVDASAGPRVN